MPFIAALSAILPLVWIEPFVIPVNIPAMVGSGEFVTTANQLLENLLTPGTLYGSSDLWDIPDLSMYHVWTVGNTFITWDRLLMALPITLLGGSLVWGCLNLSGYLYGKYRSRQTKQRLRALILAGVAGFTVMYVAGAGIQALKVVSYIQYGSQERFDQVVNDYLTVYDSYRNYEKHDGPVLEYGADRMDPQYLDTALAATERYDVYRGVFAIDYDGWKIYHIANWQDRIDAKYISVFVGSVASVIGILVCWRKYRQWGQLEEEPGEEKEQEAQTTQQMTEA